MQSVHESRLGTTRSVQSRARGLSDSVELAPHPGSVAVARLHVRRLLGAWGLSELQDPAEQIVSELAANAIRVHQSEHPEEPVRLILLAGLRTLLVIVRDASAAVPVPGNPAEDAENGRGLLIVNALADRWDVKVTSDGGKAVRVFLRGRRQACPSQSARGTERGVRHDRVA